MRVSAFRKFVIFNTTNKCHKLLEGDRTTCRFGNQLDVNIVCYIDAQHLYLLRASMTLIKTKLGFLVVVLLILELFFRFANIDKKFY
jgi:hypothetical protein